MSLILADFHEVFVHFAKQAVKSRIVLDSNIKKIGKSCHTSNPVNGAKYQIVLGIFQSSNTRSNSIVEILLQVVVVATDKPVHLSFWHSRQQLKLCRPPISSFLPKSVLYFLRSELRTIGLVPLVSTHHRT